MKIDCSVTKNFLKERNRMCGSQKGCMTCPNLSYKQGSPMCVFSEEMITDAIKIVQTWSDNNQPEIDWTKVPMGTPVLVKDKSDIEWRKRYFVIYLPNANEKFCTFNSGDTRENAEGVSCWSECKLADNVDPTPFYKRRKE